MKVWHLVGALLVAGGLALFMACGDTTDDVRIITIAFTPIPTQTPVPKLCGNGVVDAEFEHCEQDSDCTGEFAGKRCVCCICLADADGSLGEEDLGLRVFEILHPPSAFLTTGLAGGDPSTGAWLPGPLKIVAGRPDPDLPGEQACSAPVSLQEDAIFGFKVIDGSTLCVKIFAEGSTGVIDCDGGTAHDVEGVIDSNGNGDNGPFEIETGQGDAALAGPGAVTLRVERVLSINLPASAGVGTEYCAVANYDDPLANPNVNPKGGVADFPTAFTTTRGTGTLLNPAQGGNQVTLSVTGQAFSCATWSTSASRGVLAAPLPGPDQVVGDTMNGFILSDQPPAP